MDGDLLAERFEANRGRLRSIAQRMLGSTTEAEDAVQEAWLRLGRADAETLNNLDAWLTTVVGRICLDVLRARASHPEAPLDVVGSVATEAADPEREAVLADSMGLALLVVLETLSPAERLSFVLHDMFAVSFDEIALIVGRSPAAARQLASRARRRVQAGPPRQDGDTDRARPIVGAFLAAARTGDFAGLLELLDPDVVMRADAAAVAMGGTAYSRGSAVVAGFFSGRARAAEAALIDGAAGLAVMMGGELRIALEFTVVDGRIRAIDAIADAELLGGLEVELLPG